MSIQDVDFLQTFLNTLHDQVSMASEYFPKMVFGNEYEMVYWWSLDRVVYPTEHTGGKYTHMDVLY